MAARNSTLEAHYDDQRSYGSIYAPFVLLRRLPINRTPSFSIYASCQISDVTIFQHEIISEPRRERITRGHELVLRLHFSPFICKGRWFHRRPVLHWIDVHIIRLWQWILWAWSVTHPLILIPLERVTSDPSVMLNKLKFLQRRFSHITNTGFPCESQLLITQWSCFESKWDWKLLPSSLEVLMRAFYRIYLGNGICNP